MVQVPVQPLAHIAITVQIVFAPVGIQTQHIGILLRIHPEPIFPAITAEAAFRRPPAIGRQCAAVFQHAAVILIKAKGVDNIIKRSFEILCFQIRTEIKKVLKKPLPLLPMSRGGVQSIRSAWKSAGFANSSNSVLPGSLPVLSYPLAFLLLSVFLLLSLLKYRKIMLHPLGLILRLQYAENIPALKAALTASVNLCAKDC